MRRKILLLFFLASLIPLSVAYAAEERQCLDCHKALRAGKVVHPALEAGCPSCHAAPHAKKKPELSLVSAPPDLCFNCHDKAVFTKKVQHSAVAAGMCTSCHNPHSSNNRKLLKAEQPELCYTCHDKGMFTKKTVHAPVAAGMCGDCHNPHSSDTMFQLPKPIDDLCVSCHTETNIANGVHIARGFKASGHPIKEKKDPLRSGREFACTACHDPHSSDWVKLYRYKARSAFELCQYCHKK